MDLFDDLPPLPGLAREGDAALLQAVETVMIQAPLRHMQTPGGFTMSVATTSCGSLGWVSDLHGYRYAAHDPHTGQSWPAMPACFLALAASAAAQAGYVDFVPDACLVNQYAPSAIGWCMVMWWCGAAPRAWPTTA